MKKGPPLGKRGAPFKILKKYLGRHFFPHSQTWCLKKGVFWAPPHIGAHFFPQRGKGGGKKPGVLGRHPPTGEGRSPFSPQKKNSGSIFRGESGGPPTKKLCCGGVYHKHRGGVWPFFFPSTGRRKFFFIPPPTNKKFFFFGGAGNTHTRGV